MSTTLFTVADDKKSLVVERTFSAPKTKVWQAWTTADILKEWFSPKGWETKVVAFDFTEGGAWEYTMKCVDETQGEWFGVESPGKSIYSNILPEDSFENTDYFTDGQGTVNQEFPVSRSLIVFVENEDKTTLVTSTNSYDTPEDLKKVLEMGMKEGLSQSWDKLAELMEK